MSGPVLNKAIDRNLNCSILTTTQSPNAEKTQRWRGGWGGTHATRPWSFPEIKWGCLSKAGGEEGGGWGEAVGHPRILTRAHTCEEGHPGLTFMGMLNMEPCSISKEASLGLTRDRAWRCRA